MRVPIDVALASLLENNYFYIFGFSATGTQKCKDILSLHP